MRVTVTFFQTSWKSPISMTSQRLARVALQWYWPSLLTPLGGYCQSLSICGSQGPVVVHIANLSSLKKKVSLHLHQLGFFSKAWDPIVLVKTKVKKVLVMLACLVLLVNNSPSWLTLGQRFPSVSAVYVLEGPFLVVFDMLGQFQFELRVFCFLTVSLDSLAIPCSSQCVFICFSTSGLLLYWFWAYSRL